MHIKAHKLMYNRHESGTEVHETRWTTKNSGTRKRKLRLECETDCSVLRMKKRDDTCLAVASVGLFGSGRFPVEVYPTLRSRSGSAVGTGSGLWSRQRQLFGYRDDQR